MSEQATSLEQTEVAQSSQNERLWEIVRLFLRLGFTAFGGPAAHIAMMHDEVVKRRKWVTEQHFLDMLGATNLIPGPNSTEMAIHLGYVRAGWTGLILAGACFISPAMLIVMALAWLYKQYGTTPEATWLLYGIKPVIIAIILIALYKLIRTAIKGPLGLVLAVAIFGLSLLGFNELALLFGGALVMMVLANAQRLRRSSLPAIALPLLPVTLPALPLAAAVPFSLLTLFLTFLKIGAVLYGSGYVLLAFLHGDFVDRLGWLTDQQLLDAISIGQFTPGPVFTTATFIGYLLGDAPGAVLATVAIFLPAFIFVAISNPFIPKMRRSPWVSGLLDGANIAALGLMATVTLQLGIAAIRDVPTVILLLLSLIILLRWNINSVWLIIAGALFGIIRFFTTGA